VSLLIGEDVSLKLVYIFKFLWKLKKIEYLCLRLGCVKYVNIVYKLSYYIFNEILEDMKVFSWSETELAFDDLGRQIHRKLDEAIAKMHINTSEKRMEYLLFHMENCFMTAGKTGVFDDKSVQEALKNFCVFVSSSIKGTALFDLPKLLN